MEELAEERGLRSQGHPREGDEIQCTRRPGLAWEKE